MAEEKTRTMTCPLCGYEHAEIHDLVAADTGVKYKVILICPNCKNERKED